nr:auxilin-like protein [Tanacetum cinerariifolium]
MMVLVRQTENCDRLLHMVMTDMKLLVIEIETADITANDVDKGYVIPQTHKRWDGESKPENHKRITDTSSLVNHNAYMASSSAPQIDYAPMVQQSSEYSPPEAGLVVPVFQKGDDHIDTINHMMSFLTAVVTSRVVSGKDDCESGSDRATVGTNVKQCLRKVSDGHFTAAVKVLCSSGVAPFGTDTLSALLAKHPILPPPVMPGSLPSEPPLVVDVDTVLGCIQSFPKGTSCGRDGLRPQHLLDAFCGEGSAIAVGLLKAISVVVNLLLEGKCPKVLAEFVASAPLTPLFKPDNGIRPIAVGAIWRRFFVDSIMQTTHVSSRAILVYNIWEAVSIFDNGLRRAIEAIVVCGGPFFGDFQWRLASLPIRFCGLGLCSAEDVSTYAFVASRAQSWCLQDHILEGCGIDEVDSDYGYAHDLVRDVLYDVLKRAGISSKKEAPVNFLTDLLEGRSILRPADILVFGWAGGKHACVDLTGVSPLVGFRENGFVAGQAALKAESSKVAKHEKACLENQHVFIPFAFDTFGFLAPETEKFLNRVQRVVQKEMTREAIEKIYERILILQEPRPIIKTLKFSDQHKKLLDSVMLDKLKRDGEVQMDEEEATEEDMPIVVGRSILYTCGGIINTIKGTTSTFDGVCYQKFHVATVRNKHEESDEDEEEYCVERDEMGKPTSYTKDFEADSLLDQKEPVNMKPWKKLCSHTFITNFCIGELVTELLSLIIDEDLMSKKVIKFRLGGRGHTLTILEFARHLGLYTSDEIQDEGFETYFVEFMTKIARRAIFLTGEVLDDLSSPIYCRSLDTTTLREMIDSSGRLIAEEPAPGDPIVVVPRPPRHSIFDLYKKRVVWRFDKGDYAPPSYDEEQDEK